MSFAASIESSLSELNFGTGRLEARLGTMNINIEAQYREEFKAR